MNTIEVPCERCDEFRRRLENQGYVVEGCDPVDSDMCSLRYRRPGEAAAADAGVQP